MNRSIMTMRIAGLDVVLVEFRHSGGLPRAVRRGGQQMAAAPGSLSSIGMLLEAAKIANPGHRYALVVHQMHGGQTGTIVVHTRASAPYNPNDVTID